MVAGKDRIAVYIVCSAYFLIRVEVLNNVLHSNDGVLVVVCRSNMLSHGMHMSLVGCQAILEVFVDEGSCETRNGLYIVRKCVQECFYLR